MRQLFLLATVFLLVSSQCVSAAITSPYTVDEKNKVLFGDSAEITASSTVYHGLENYNTEYVNNYLHITFTYTHHQLNFASYPPKLYITSTDPRATSTPVVRSPQLDVYQLVNYNNNPAHVTDWYKYDVQFDVAGYNVTVLQAGSTTTTSFHQDISNLVNSDWAALANLYPIQEPGFDQSFSMSFTPLPIYEMPPELVATTTPVIIVPGIIGSRLVDLEYNEKWPNIFLMTASFEDLYLDDLSLDTNGEGGSSIVASSIIKSIGNKNYFSSLFTQLYNSNLEENEDTFEFPYDWRLDIEFTSLALKNKIDEIKAERGVEKVHLVAHSMGGLLVKKYLKDYGGESVDKFVDIGTPHTGSPNAFKLLNYGDSLDVNYLLGLVGFNGQRIKTISQNMPSVYQLLPSGNYFDEMGHYVIDLTNGTNRYNFLQTKDYLKAEGRNSLLVNRADEFHQEIDNLNPANYGVETYNFVGCGTPTIGQFYILESGEHPIYNIRYINGDGTVPLKSAEAMTASSTFYVRNAQHALMPSTSGVKELIVEILTATSTHDFDISPHSNLALDSNDCNIPDGKIVSMHSPIELHIYDSSDNHAGPDANGDVENNISGVVYEVIGGNKFAYLPDGVEYTVKGSATDTGTFDVRIQEIISGEVATTTVFADIPLTLNTKAQFLIGSTTPSQIELDNENDGVYESSQGITTSVIGILESTGKLVAAMAAPISHGGQSLRSASTYVVEAVVEVVATTSESIVLLQVVTLATEVNQEAIGNPSTEPIEEVAATTTTELEYKSTAIVYKSFTGKIAGLFRDMWGWFKYGLSLF